MGNGASSGGKTLPSSKELALFEEMDKDCSGSIDISELLEALKDFSAKVQNDWPQEDLEKVIHFFDKNHDQKLDKEEYTEAVKELKKREATRAAGGGRSTRRASAAGATKAARDHADEARADAAKAKEKEREHRIAETEKKRQAEQTKKDEHK